MADKEVFWENYSNAKYVKVQLKNTKSYMYFNYLTNKITTKNVHNYFFALKIEFYVKLAKFINNFDLCPRGISQGAKRL
jgi:hypothetical protein